MNVVKMKLADLKRPERNVRMHTEKQLKEFERSVTMFGQIRPIVVDDNHVILAGNGLYETLLRMGREEADVLLVSGLTENEKKKLMLADNKIYGLGVDDLESFDAFIAELRDDLDIPGFDEDLLQSMISEASAITDQLMEYGTLDESEIVDIRAARERKEQAMAEGTSKPESAPPAAGQDGERGPARQSVVCPHCGETIWL